MAEGHLSLILLPTLGCNAECDYCFENKSEERLGLDKLAFLMKEITDHMELNHWDVLSIYWQGGEVLTLPPEWFERAKDIVSEAAADRKIQVFNYLQSNLIEYGKKWNRVLTDVFSRSVGSSMDYPNLYRKPRRGGPKEYEAIWKKKLYEARESGIEVGVIAIPNELTLKLGAERFYSYFADELAISDFQINTPFPGGSKNNVKEGFPLENDGLSRFLIDVAKIWFERGLDRGIRIEPFNRLMDYFLNGRKDLLCIWRENCSKDFICIDPRGYIAQCDCWVASYPEFRFGNIFNRESLGEILEKSAARQSLLSRPGKLIRQEDCLDCDYLGLCHGGCPVRAYTVYGTIFRKDPYCGLYRELFRAMEKMAQDYLKKHSGKTKGEAHRGKAMDRVGACRL